MNVEKMMVKEFLGLLHSESDIISKETKLIDAMYQLGFVNNETALAMDDLVTDTVCCTDAKLAIIGKIIDDHITKDSTDEGSDKDENK